MLPDVNEFYPQIEDKPVQACDYDKCGNDIYEGDEVIEHAGYHFCSGDCLVDQMLQDGNALKLVIGR